MRVYSLPIPRVPHTCIPYKSNLFQKKPAILLFLILTFKNKAKLLTISNGFVSMSTVCNTKKKGRIFGVLDTRIIFHDSRRFFGTVHYITPYDKKKKSKKCFFFFFTADETKKTGLLIVRPIRKKTIRAGHTCFSLHPDSRAFGAQLTACRPDLRSLFHTHRSRYARAFQYILKTPHCRCGRRPKCSPRHRIHGDEIHLATKRRKERSKFVRIARRCVHSIDKAVFEGNVAR